MNQSFLDAINKKLLVQVTFNSKEKGVIKRKCVPFDYGPSRYKGNAKGPAKYHFYDLNSPSGSHNLPLLPEQLLRIDITEEHFDPAQYVTWSPIRWFVKRDWGDYS